MIEVGRNSIIVRNVDKDSNEFKKVNYAYSLYDKVKHKYVFSVFTVIDSDLYFPASIGVDNIEKYFPDKKVVYNYMTTAKAASMSYNMRHAPKNELQQKAIRFMMTMRKDNKVRSRFLSLATGSGKTYVSINVISQLKKKAMIIVDSISLAEQWRGEFLKHTDLKESHIVILSGQDIVNAESKKPTAKIYIAIHRTLGNMLATDTNSVNLLMNKLHIGIRVFDESHVEFGNICKLNSLSNVEYTIYLTATPSRSNFIDNSLYAKVFGKIPYFNGKDLSGEKYHTVIFYPMNSSPSITQKTSCRTKYGFSIQKWAGYISSDEAYPLLLEAISGIFSKFKLTERKMKTAIVLPTIKLIKKVSEDLKLLYPGIDIGLFIGELKPKEREEAKEKMFMITDDKMFDKAIDIPDLEILINVVDFGSLVKTEQMIGRLRYHEGKQSIYIDVVDNGFDECIAHSKIRKRFFKKHAKQIIEISKGEF